MADGLLLTRRERARAYWTKTGLALAVPLVLAVAALADGAGVTAVVVAGLALCAALVAGSSARTTRGAAATGVVVTAVLVLLQIVLAWLATHPILPD